MARAAAYVLPILNAKQAQRATDAYRLALWFAQPFIRRWPGHDDTLYDAAITGLLEASCRFDPTREAKFITFARYFIRSKLLNEHRRLMALEKYGVQSLGRFEVVDRHRSTLAAVDARDFMAVALPYVPPGYRPLLEASLIEARGTLSGSAQAAAKLGIKESWGSEMYNKSLHYIREGMGVTVV